MKKKCIKICLFFLVLHVQNGHAQISKNKLTINVGATYHTPLFSNTKAFEYYSNSLLLSRDATGEGGFSRIEFRGGISYRIKQKNIEFSFQSFLGQGELYSYAYRVGNDVFRKREPSIFWTQGIHVNKYNKPKARHVFYYGAGFNVINIGKRFDAQLRSSLWDPNPANVTVQMQAASFSAQMGRSIGKYGFSRNLMLELKAEYIPKWGQYLYSKEIKWLRFGSSLYYRFHFSEKQKKQEVTTQQL
jgi:hypothetical protein